MTAASPDKSRRLLSALDPSRQAIIPAGVRIAAQDPEANARITEYGPGFYKIHFRSASGGALRLSSAYFDGWKASSNGRELQVFPIDHALLCIAVPPGEGDLLATYSSKYFGTGTVVTGVCLILSIWALVNLGRGPLQ